MPKSTTLHQVSKGANQGKWVTCPAQKQCRNGGVHISREDMKQLKTQAKKKLGRTIKMDQVTAEAAQAFLNNKTQEPTTTETVNQEIQQAYNTAKANVKAEKNDSPEVQEARRNALLRWAGKGNNNAKEFINPEMQKAYEEALTQVKKESETPAAERLSKLQKWAKKFENPYKKATANIVPPQVLPLAAELRKVWSSETTAATEWDPRRPETGQCAVTALIVQDQYGGTLNRAVVNGESHYWNTLPDGTEVDLSRAQFDEPVTIEDVQKRDREYLFTSEATTSRYNELKQRLEKHRVKVQENK